MTEKQKNLLYQLAEIFQELAEECINDESFHEIMIANNDLFPMSLDDLASEWYAVAEEARK